MTGAWRLYLVVNEQNVCDAVSVGCVDAGREEALTFPQQRGLSSRGSTLHGLDSITNLTSLPPALTCPRCWQVEPR